MAEDWEVGVGGEIEKIDDSQKRFSLLELNVLDDVE
jgi:hypothetical protein